MGNESAKDADNRKADLAKKAEDLKAEHAKELQRLKDEEAERQRKHEADVARQKAEREEAEAKRRDEHEKEVQRLKLEEAANAQELQRLKDEEAEKQRQHEAEMARQKAAEEEAEAKRRDEHEKELLRLKEEAEQKQRQYEADMVAKKHQLQVELDREKAAKEKEEALRQAAHEKELEELKIADAVKEREYQAEMARQKAAREEAEAKKKAEHEKAMEAQRIEHEQQQAREKKQAEEALRQFAKDNVAQQKEQRDKQVEAIQQCINDSQKRKNQREESLKTALDNIKKRKIQCDKLALKVKGFNIENKVMQEKNEMVAALKKHAENENEIEKAIAKTGQTEDNVANFLRLTHALIGGTMAAQAQTNALDARIAVFYDMISRECRDRLSIEYLFKQRGLERFTPILAKKKMIDCEDLVCENELEFEQSVFNLLETSVDKEVQQWNKEHPDDPVVNTNPLECFLKEYKIEKFAAALADCGAKDLEDLSELEDEDVEGIIKDSGLKGLFVKRFKRAVQAYKDGKYKAPQAAEQKENETTAVATTDKAAAVEKPAFIQSQERKTLLNISTNSKTAWIPKQEERAIVVRASMETVSPLLARFFLRMHEAITKSQKLLTYSRDGLNEEQEKAVKMLQSAEQLKSIGGVNGDGGDDAKQEENKQDGQSSTDENKQDEQASTEEAPSLAEDIMLPDYVQRKAWVKGDACQVHSDSSKKWCDGTIDDIDADGEYMQVSFGHEQKRVSRYGDDVRFPMNIQTRAIKAAVKVNTNVVAIMRPRFEVSDATREALPIAMSIESSCRQILESQVHMQDCVRLASELLNFKPADLDGRVDAQRYLSKPTSGDAEQQKADADADAEDQKADAEDQTADADAEQQKADADGPIGGQSKDDSQKRMELWKAVDDGIVNIIRNALEMGKISEQYFGFFLRFNQGFQKYMAITENEKTKDVSLFTALKYVRDDVSAFGEFKAKFESKVKLLNAECMKVIKQCVQKQAGAGHLEQVMAEREQRKQEYLKKKAAYDEKWYKLQLELHDIKTAQILINTALETEQLRARQLDESIKQDSEELKSYKDAKVKLSEMVFEQVVDKK